MKGLKVEYIALFLLLFSIACNQLPEEKKLTVADIPVIDEIDLIRKRNSACILTLDTTTFNTGTFNKSHSAAFGFQFAYPAKNIFKEREVNIEEGVDTISYFLSNDKAASFIIWLEILDFSDCGKDDTSTRYIINAVNKIDTLTAGMIRDYRIPKIGKLTLHKECKGSNGFGFTTAIVGEDKKYGYVYKFLSGQVPKSHIAIHYLFKYNRKNEAQYKPMGIYMANSLGGNPNQP